LDILRQPGRPHPGKDTSSFLALEGFDHVLQEII
jgi:hypothetical protein